MACAGLTDRWGSPGVAQRDKWDPASQRNVMGPKGVENDALLLSRVEELVFKAGIWQELREGVSRTMPSWHTAARRRQSCFL